ncbi:MAG: hypothetical protein OEQ53_08130 [Saprospiraceae bacterium]|nr:hypothetical protein [Saprospiraceae bacterium]
MIRIILALAILFGIAAFYVQGQSKLSERSLLGTWELVIEDLDFTDKTKYAGKDRARMSPGERLGAALETGIFSFLGDLLEDFEIHFTFLKEHQVEMEIEILGEREVKYLQWELTDHNQVIISEDDADEIEDGDIWILEDGKLISTEKNKGEQLEKDYDTYMVKVK